MAITREHLLPSRSPAPDPSATRARQPRTAGVRAMPVLFLVADTGGGHRAAAGAISEELGRAYPGVFAPVLCDPLGGPG